MVFADVRVPVRNLDYGITVDEKNSTDIGIDVKLPEAPRTEPLLGGRSRVGGRPVNNRGDVDVAGSRLSDVKLPPIQYETTTSPLLAC